MKTSADLERNRGRELARRGPSRPGSSRVDRRDQGRLNELCHKHIFLYNGFIQFERSLLIIFHIISRFPIAPTSKNEMRVCARVCVQKGGKRGVGSAVKTSGSISAGGTPVTAVSDAYP